MGQSPPFSIRNSTLCRLLQKHFSSMIIGSETKFIKRFEISRWNTSAETLYSYIEGSVKWVVIKIQTRAPPHTSVSDPNWLSMARRCNWAIQMLHRLATIATGYARTYRAWKKTKRRLHKNRFESSKRTRVGVTGHHLSHNYTVPPVAIRAIRRQMGTGGGEHCDPNIGATPTPTPTTTPTTARSTWTTITTTATFKFTTPPVGSRCRFVRLDGRGGNRIGLHRDWDQLSAPENRLVGNSWASYKADQILYHLCRKSNPNQHRLWP